MTNTNHPTSAATPSTSSLRRDFLTTTASGLGALALGSLLTEDGVLAAPQTVTHPSYSLPSFAPKAKNCIFLFQAGAPSHLDLFDSKPKLKELHGQQLPPSMTENVRFAFIKKETAILMGSNRKFSRYGQSGMELCDLLPHLGTVADDLLLVRSMHTDQFNHHPGQLMMQCGRGDFGLPAMGSWLTYGLGTESQNLPGYVVLTSGRGSSGGATLWSSGFLPSTYAGVLFRDTGDPVLNLQNPMGLPPELQRAGLNTLQRLNQRRYQQVRDPEISSRIANYELAYRMQQAAPDLIDLSQESQHTLDSYGAERPEPSGIGGRGKQGETFKSFARNCLLARRMVERGVRFINIMYASWDHHSDIDDQLPYNAGVIDQPIAALIRDLKTRGMLDETLVVCAGEFGRTPLAENRSKKKLNTGRDHHPFAYSLFMAGGGLKGGQVYGASDEIGWSVIDRPVHVNDFHATLLRLFGMDHLQLTYRFQSRDFRLTDVGGQVIPDWIA
ncbi:MAG: sulfatase [Planctomycetaceae bacterium]|nr:sulfatase [Planctomycetaceae bacterium]MBP62035.1 sulfatase [Planctomycetaceae bacterium]